MVTFKINLDCYGDGNHSQDLAMSNLPSLSKPWRIQLQNINKKQEATVIGSNEDCVLIKHSTVTFCVMVKQRHFNGVFCLFVCVSVCRCVCLCVIFLIDRMIDKTQRLNSPVFWRPIQKQEIQVQGSAAERNSEASAFHLAALGVKGTGVEDCRKEGIQWLQCLS